MRRSVPVILCAAVFALLAGCSWPSAGSDSPETPSPSDASPASAGVAEIVPKEDPVVPVREAVDDEWFSNTAMIGHSLMEGMRLNSGLDTPDYYTLVGASVAGLLSSSEVRLPDGRYGSLASALTGAGYDHVYLFMGINEIDGALDALRSNFQQLLDLVRDKVPGADIYVLAVLPVTRDKAAEGVFTVSKITAYNEMLQQLCAEQGCWYVDTYNFYADNDGYLPASASNDGIHLYAGEYPELLRYIKRHTAE